MFASRRRTVIAILVVVELWIVGLMLRSVTGGSRRGAFAAPVEPAGVAAATGGASQTIETGPEPHVVIDDGDALLSVSVRPGSTVTVAQTVRTTGWTHGAGSPARVAQTPDGVRIGGERGTLLVAFGAIERRLDVVVPPGARLDVENSGSATVTGLRAEATLHSDDGSVIVHDLVGALTVKTDNGRIELAGVRGPSVDLHSDDGRIVCDALHSPDVEIATGNGSIDVRRSLLGGGKIQTDNGRIRLELDPQSDVTVSARASSGRVTADAPLIAASGPGDDDDDAPSVIRVGSGAGRLDVASDNGSITVRMGV